MKKIQITISLLLISVGLIAQDIVPSIYTHIQFDGKNGFAINSNGQLIPESISENFYNLPNMMGHPKGNGTGFEFDFNSKTFTGTLYFGLINFKNSKYAQPVYFKRPSKIQNGYAKIDMKWLTGSYDMVGWEQQGKGHLAYRVVDVNGKILYDGILSFQKKLAFEVLPTIVEGPMLSMQTDSSIVVKFKTNYDTFCNILVNGIEYKELKPLQNHEIQILNLKGNTTYSYEIECSDNRFSYSFKTAPKKGSREAFTFAYASDSRGGIGGGERNVYGTNAYILKKAIALAVQQGAAFMQFTGDLINGYTDNIQNMQLQYANFKHVVSPFTAYMPLQIGIGNHEIVERSFPIKDEYGINIDRFPFDTESMEAVFAHEFANPLNGPESEDGSECDPDTNTIDFPSYKENVYYYIYDNVAVIVLNSEYLYAPSIENHPETSGGLHGYFMDKQLQWLESTLNELEKDSSIDHIFVTQHTPAFPNGGHVEDAMWYNGNNNLRTIIAGKPLKRGVIEQRDIYLNLLINKSKKVKAILTGDEHNYCKTHISPGMPMYPESWSLPKLELKRAIYQINNGACGAPYYAQEKTPWQPYTSGFSTQNALVLFDVDGEKIRVRVLNPDSLEEIESFDLE